MNVAELKYGPGLHCLIVFRHAIFAVGHVITLCDRVTGVCRLWDDYIMYMY